MSRELITDEGVRQSYGGDASGLVMVPDAIARPESVSEVAEILRQASSSKTPVTPAGAQTSTTAASIADRGIVLSTRALSGVLDFDRTRRIMRVQCGALLGDVKRAAAAEGFLFAPDPTSENESTVGGAIACNASGARSLRYGATRGHISGLKVVLASGESIQIGRSRLEKNTVGYAFAHDPVDWFIGSEGTLGIVVEADLILLPMPDEVMGIAFPFSTEQDAVGFIVAARESKALSARCIEYFDILALAIARSADERAGWAADAAGMVYVEQEMTTDDGEALERWLELAEKFNTGADVRVFQGDAELRLARRIRHAVPSTMNERGSTHRSSGGRKVSTDWAVPYSRFGEALSVARGIAEGHGIEQPVIYGHAGNGHPHQNFIARNVDELAVIDSVIEETLQRVIEMGGTVAAEHGIGKLKRKWLSLQMSEIQIGAMRAVKRELDPQWIMSPGNIL
ncbi:MAG TPA: FAD-binding oxidoreductase [Gemmatimonadaceae bacterium]|nr:FAD-binding oxidoreductase [Gemmatimonadaceae bacterium]